MIPAGAELMDLKEVRKKRAGGTLRSCRTTGKEDEFIAKHKISFSAVVHRALAELMGKAKK